MRVRLGRSRWDDAGSVTVEAAFALAGIVVVVIVCLGALLTVLTAIRAVDVAHEAALVLARGGDAAQVRAELPEGFAIDVGGDAAVLTVEVRARPTMLPLGAVHAAAHAPRESAGAP